MSLCFCLFCLCLPRSSPSMFATLESTKHPLDQIKFLLSCNIDAQSRKVMDGTQIKTSLDLRKVLIVTAP